jgi:DNA-binding PadR family transcriptional regulator
MWHSYLCEFFGKEPEEHWFFGGRRFRGWHATAEPGTFNPFVGLMLAKGGGLLPLVVLHLLERKPHYGNEIMKEIQKHTRGRWVTNPGVIYPMLGFMEERGLVQGAWEDETRRTRRFYHTTSRGSEELARLKEVMQPRLMEALDILQGLLEDLYAAEA